jgi:ketosteroid isomerase-like protein
MNKPPLLLKVTLFGLCSVLCLAPKSPAAEMSKEARELAGLDDQWSAAAGARDVEKVASFYAPDAVAYPPNEVAAVGRANARAAWAAMLADPSLKISWKASHAEVAKGGGLGYTAGAYALSVKGPDGKTIHDTGKYLCVWQKGPDGKWQSIHDMWNSDLKP